MEIKTVYIFTKDASFQVRGSLETSAPNALRGLFAGFFGVLTNSDVIVFFDYEAWELGQRMESIGKSIGQGIASGLQR